jgi:hypothetical protein
MGLSDWTCLPAKLLRRYIVCSQCSRLWRQKYEFRLCKRDYLHTYTRACNRIACVRGGLSFLETCTSHTRRNSAMSIGKDKKAGYANSTDMFCKYAPRFSLYIIIHLLSHCSFILFIHLFVWFIFMAVRIASMYRVFKNSYRLYRCVVFTEMNNLCPNYNAYLNTDDVRVTSTERVVPTHVNFLQKCVFFQIFLVSLASPDKSSAVLTQFHVKENLRPYNLVKKNSMAWSPRADHTDRATAAGQRSSADFCG